MNTLITPAQAVALAFADGEYLAPESVTQSDIAAAEQRYIVPVIGRRLYEKLLAGSHASFTTEYLAAPAAFFTRIALQPRLDVRTGQCGTVAPKSAAYQLVFHNHFFRRKSKHHTAFVLGIVGSLIRRIDKYSVIKRHGHCTLRLQKGMFRPRSFIMSGHFIFRVGDHFFCISSDQMLMGEYISIRLDSRMNAGCVLF